MSIKQEITKLNKEIAKLNVTQFRKKSRLTAKLEVLKKLYTPPSKSKPLNHKVQAPRMIQYNGEQVISRDLTTARNRILKKYPKLSQTSEKFKKLTMDEIGKISVESTTKAKFLPAKNTKTKTKATNEKDIGKFRWIVEVKFKIGETYSGKKIIGPPEYVTVKSHHKKSDMQVMMDALSLFSDDEIGYDNRYAGNITYCDSIQIISSGVYI